MQGTAVVFVAPIDRRYVLLTVEIVDTYVADHFAYANAAVMAQAHIQAMHSGHHVAVALMVGIQAHQVAKIAVGLVADSAVGVGRILRIVYVIGSGALRIVIVILVEHATAESAAGQ